MTDTQDTYAERRAFEDIVAGGVEPPRSPPDKTGRAWPKWALVGLLVVALVAGGWVLVSSLTVMKSTHDDTLAELESTAAALSASESENQTLAGDLAAVTADLEAETTRAAVLAEDGDALVSENATLTADLASANSDLSAAQARSATLEGSMTNALESIDGARSAAIALIAWDLWITPDWYAEMADAGVPVAIGDQLVELTGLPYSNWESYTTADAVFWLGSANRDVNLPALDDAFDAWYSAEINSDEEFAAWQEMHLSTLVALLERLDVAHLAAGGS